MYGKLNLPRQTYYVFTNKYIGKTYINPLKCKGIQIHNYIYQRQYEYNNNIYVWYKHKCYYCKNTQVIYWDLGFSGICYNCSCILCGMYIQTCKCNKIDDYT